MTISKPTLPPKKGYVEVEVNGRRTYRNVETGEFIENEGAYVPIPEQDSTVWEELDAAYQEGVNSAYDS